MSYEKKVLSYEFKKKYPYSLLITHYSSLPRVKQLNRERQARVLTAANMLSVSRILLVPVFLVMMLHRRIIAAFVVFLLAASTDLLDGIAARVWQQKTKLGAYLDPAGDKILMTASFIILAFPSLSFPNVVPLWLVISVVGRDMLVVTSAFVLYKLKGQKTFTPTLLGKTSTASQMGVLVFVLFFNSLQISPVYLSWLYYWTLALTILSMIHYVYIGIGMLSAPKQS